MNRLTNRRRFARLWEGTAILAAALLCTGVVFAQANDSDSATTQDQSASKGKKDQKSEQPSVKLEIQVNNANGKPVSNASVYVRYNEPGGFLHHDKLAELDLKTNEDGSVKVPPVPQGKIMIQVIATGWHTYGKWYDIEKDEESVQITLKPPPHWY